MDGTRLGATRRREALDLFSCSKTAVERVWTSLAKGVASGVRSDERGRPSGSQWQTQPETLSPNAILRPVYQECILPNVLYAGGAGRWSIGLQLIPTSRTEACQPLGCTCGRPSNGGRTDPGANGRSFPPWDYPTTRPSQKYARRG